MSRDLVIIVMCWAIWLLCGTVFYSIYSKLGWMKGIYMAVNVGYSIGWGWPVERDKASIIFSTLYVLSGSSAVAYALGRFASTILSDDKEWYVKALQKDMARQAYRQRKHTTRFFTWIYRNYSLLYPVMIWFAWMLLGALASYFVIDKWDSYQSVYFAVSSLSTGGLYAIPRDSSPQLYLAVALYSAVGVPLMALAMGNFASVFLFGKRRSSQVLKAINAKVSLSDLKTMQKFGMENNDGYVDKAEFIILCMLRIGAVDDKLVEAIVRRYDQLDVSRDGLLSYTELLGGDSDNKVPSMPLQTLVKMKSTSSSPSHAVTSPTIYRNDDNLLAPPTRSRINDEVAVLTKVPVNSATTGMSTGLSSASAKRRQYRLTLRAADDLAARVSAQRHVDDKRKKKSMTEQGPLDCDMNDTYGCDDRDTRPHVQVRRRLTADESKGIESGEADNS